MKRTWCAALVMFAACGSDESTPAPTETLPTVDDVDVPSEVAPPTGEKEQQEPEAADARRTARERAFLEEKERDVMELLRSLRASPTPLFGLVTDQQRFAKLFERHTDADALNGETLQEGVFIRDGTTLSFGAGMNEWHSRDLNRVPVQKFPKDLVIEGRGMDETLVKIDTISTRDEIRSLTFRDCTVDCGDNYLTDLRNPKNPVTIRMIRCRVIRFDHGAGGAVMLAARSAAFYASGCRFEAGFGRSPGSGNLFRVRSGLLVRIEDSVFVGPFNSVYGTNPAATYVFERCRFEQQRIPLENPPANVRFIDCSATPPPDERLRKKKPLSELNPAWTGKRR